jgi:hypothetical protein
VTQKGDRREPIFFKDGNQEVYRDPWWSDDFAPESDGVDAP